MRRVVLLALALPLLAAGCGGGGEHDLDITIVSRQTSGTGTGGTIVGIHHQGQALDPTRVPVSLVLFEDVVLAEIRWVDAPDLEGDRLPDRIELRDGVVLLGLSSGPELAFAAAEDAVEVRAADANGDARADLVVRRADGRVDLYLNHSGS
jgi:hypothetical protein